MARQVAHDIKNPLTPIQLSAEHARRVNLDRGSPLSPVLDECVNAILSQVTPAPADLLRVLQLLRRRPRRMEGGGTPRLIDGVVEPYRAGLVSHVRIAVEHSTAPVRARRSHIALARADEPH